MSRLNEALAAFRKVYREGSAPVSSGVPSADEADASEMDAWPMRRDPKNTVSSGGYRVLDSEGGDSRRGAGGPGYPVDKSDPEDPMAPGWRGPALDDEEEVGASGSFGNQYATGEDEEEAYAGEPRAVSTAPIRVAVRCANCGEANTVRLPKHVTLRSAYAGEADASEGKARLMRTQCGACSEKIRFTAPPGHRFVNRESAAVHHFKQRYGYLSGKSGHNPILRGLRSAREAFRRSYFNR